MFGFLSLVVSILMIFAILHVAGVSLKLITGVQCSFLLGLITDTCFSQHSLSASYGLLHLTSELNSNQTISSEKPFVGHPSSILG